MLYMLQAVSQPIIRSRVPCSVRLSRTLHGTQYTHHNLKYLLPQHRITYNDVFLLINSTIL